MWRCAWAWVCGFCLGLGLVLGLGLSRRSSSSPSPSPSRVTVSAAWARFLRGFPSAIPAPPGALPTKQTRQNASFSFVLGFVWCASPVRKSRLYGTIAPRSAFVCHPDALHLPAGVVARSLRFRLVLIIRHEFEKKKIIVKNYFFSLFYNIIILSNNKRSIRN